MSFNYGLSHYDLLNVRRKIDRQKDYLENNRFLGDGGNVKTLLDVSYSANLSARYYPRILNKVDTFVSMGENMGLVPIFLTITLDGFFRNMMRGDFSKWTEKLRDKYSKHIPNNGRSGYYLDYIDSHNTLTPKDLYKILGHQLHRFTKCNTLQKIRRLGYDYSMIRVTEPHKDGVPHFHILMYLPKHFISNVFNEFKNYFPAPRNHVPLTMKNTTGDNKRDGDLIDYLGNTETMGFQISLKSASGYILKYILKSFTNLINEEQIDYLQAWYIHNRIPRLITTHTLVSQDIYHKVSILESDWYYLTNIKKDGGITKSENNDQIILDDGIGRKIIIDDGLVYISNKGKIVSRYGKKKTNSIDLIRLRNLDFIKFANLKPPTYDILYRYKIWTPPKKYSYYINKIFDDGTLSSFGDRNDFHLTFLDGVEFDSQNIPISSYSDLSLFEQYYNFDFDKHVPARYALIHNELIDRGLMVRDKVSLNDFNTDFNFY